MSLKDQQCTPCRGGVDPMTKTQAASFLGQVPEWVLSDDGTRITRRFKTQNFAEAQAIANTAGEVAEAQDHHPEIRFGWGYCEVEIFTHAIGGLHENDFIYAAKVDQATR